MQFLVSRQLRDRGKKRGQACYSRFSIKKCSPETMSFRIANSRPDPDPHGCARENCRIAGLTPALQRSRIGWNRSSPAFPEQRTPTARSFTFPFGRKIETGVRPAICDSRDVGPSGLIVCRRLLPRPNGRGYCMTALRASPPAPKVICSTPIAPSVGNHCTENSTHQRSDRRYGPQTHHRNHHCSNHDD